MNSHNTSHLESIQFDIFFEALSFASILYISVFDNNGKWNVFYLHITYARAGSSGAINAKNLVRRKEKLRVTVSFASASSSLDLSESPGC